MASAEARAGYAVNRCFTDDFKMSSPVSKNLEPDFTNSDYTDSDMKWWLHVKTNSGGDANYTCQHLNTLESKLDTFGTKLHSDYVDIMSDLSVKNFNAFSCVGSATTNVYSKCMTKVNDSRTAKIEAALNNDLYLTPKKKNEDEFWFSDDVTSFLVSEQCESTMFDLESHLMGGEKTRPWWRTTGKDDLAYMVAKQSFDYIDNCDLPEPNVRKTTTLQPKGILDNDKSHVSSLNQKSEMFSSDANGFTSTTFQDSDKTLSSIESKDSDSSNTKNSRVNSDSMAKEELLKALCRSQTRAREAEKAAQEACDEKDHIFSLFFKQASQLFAYKQWIHVLQLENLCLQFRNKNKPLQNNLGGKQHRKSRRKIKSRRQGFANCAFAIAIGLALAGAGLILGWTIGCMFPSF